MRNLLISAAEPSGDLLAAQLVVALRERGEVHARGVAGPAMRAAGVEAVACIEDIAVMGIIEVLLNLRTITATRRQMERTIDAAPADATLVVVDGPSFNLPLAARAKARGLRVVGLVSPQVWAWRPGRVHHIARAMDRLLCLLEFEPALYAGTGLEASWIGHPMLDRLPRRTQVDPTLYGLLPGSRAQERARLLPVFLDVAERIRAVRPQAHFRIVVPPGAKLPPVPFEVTHDVDALRHARAALTKSGTVTLELAVMGVPQVVAHRVHPLTWLLGRLLVRGVHHMAMPNVLADMAAGGPAPAVVPEHLQHLDPTAIAADVLALPASQPVDLRPLGLPGGASRAAAAVLDGWSPP